jgi:DNA-binding NarL/FixJ family response regulator
MNSRLKVLVVDDHATVREGLIRILTGAGLDWRVQEAANAEVALGLADQQPFDVGVVDMSMPGMNGIELVLNLRARGHSFPLLMLSMHAEPAYALRAFKAGATGYITKDRAADELLLAVQAVADGGTYVPPSLDGRVQMSLNGMVQEVPHSRLSERELGLLRHLGQGLTLPEAAERLQLSEATVFAAQGRMLEKLRLASVQEAVDYAAAQGLLR